MKKFLLCLLAAAALWSMTLVGAAVSADDIRDVHDLTNRARWEQGVSHLQWSDELAVTARQRAGELAVRYTSDHTRPDGSPFYTISNLVWGENTAYDFDSAEKLVAAWMRSAGHKRNLLKPGYTITAVAAVEADGITYWVQLFGTGNDNAEWSGNPPLDGSQNKNEAPQDPQLTLRAENDAVAADALANALRQSRNLRLVDARTLGSEALSLLQSANCVVSADTMAADGKTLQGRLILRPNALSSPIDLGVRVQGGSIDATRRALAKFYGENIALVELAQTGSLGGAAEVAVRPDLSALDTGRLYFYRYDPVANVCTALGDTGYYFDENRFLHFETAWGGIILITDKPLG